MKSEKTSGICFVKANCPICGEFGTLVSPVAKESPLFEGSARCGNCDYWISKYRNFCGYALRVKHLYFMIVYRAFLADENQMYVLRKTLGRFYPFPLPPTPVGEVFLAFSYWEASLYFANILREKEIFIEEFGRVSTGECPISCRSLWVVPPSVLFPQGAGV